MKWVALSALFLCGCCCHEVEQEPSKFYVSDEVDKGCWWNPEQEKMLCSPGCSYDGCNVCCEMGPDPHIMSCTLVACIPGAIE